MADSNDMPSISSMIITPAGDDKDANHIDGALEAIVQDSTPLPKDIDMVDVSGRLAFDPEANPDSETRENTMYNSMSYVFRSDSDNASDEGVNEGKQHTKRLVLNTCTPNVEVNKYQLMFIQQSVGYESTTSSRTIVVAYNGDHLSTEGVRWALNKFIVDNDILVVYKVIPLEMILKKGITDHYVIHQELFKRIKEMNTAKRKLRLVFEVRIGNVKYMLDRSIKDYDANFLILGNKGSKKSKLSNILSDDQSMEKQFIEEGSIPSIVINPNYEASELQQFEDINEKTFADYIKTYPSLYNPHTIHEASVIERSVPMEPEGRTSRFLRVGRSMARSVSRSNPYSSPDGRTPSAHDSALSPTTSWKDLSPVRSGSRKRSPNSHALSPARTLSPFGGLFKSKLKSK